MAAGAPAPDEAYEFVRFATGKQGQTITALGGRTVPSLIEVAESGAFLDPAQEPRHSEVFLDGVDAIRRTPVIPTWPEIEDEAEEVLTRMFYDDGYNIDDGLRASQVVTCELPTLACTPVSPVIPFRPTMNGQSPAFLVEGSGNSR